MDILEKITALAKRRGFIYPGSEIYGGLAGTWDYGPLGVELKRNIKNEYWRSIVQKRNDVVGVDAAIMMHPKIWSASGHLESFSDPLVECKKCHHRFRADHILPNAGKNLKPKTYNLKPNQCSDCGGELTEPKQFNLMVEAYLGIIEGEKQKIYLRGEITQGVHVNFKNIIDSTRVKIPFGIAQIGKAFRNEITPNTLTFRSREFEQMELQFYIKPEKKEAEHWVEYWKKERLNWYLNLGLNAKNLHFREHKDDERAHYAKAAYDIEYKFGGEWKEMEGIHHRGDWDLSRHQEYSGKDLSYFNEETREKYLPFVIETSGGVDRAALFFLADAYFEEELSEKDKRIVLKLHPRLAPYKVAVFPLLPNKPALVKKARDVYSLLTTHYSLLPIVWDDRGNIGKRYRAQDEIGTPYCVTIDFNSLENDDVTVRERDTMKQERVKIKELGDYLEEKIK